MKNDRLSDALRGGDPAEPQSEAQSVQERKAALLARCAAEPFTEPSFLPQPTRSRKTRWTIPALAGAGTLTAAALYGAMAWFGPSTTAHQTVLAKRAQTSPRPLSATPTPRKLAVPAPTPQPASSGRAIVQAVEPQKTKTRRDTDVADSAPTVRAAKHAGSAKSLRHYDALSPAPAKAVVRVSRKKKGNGPRLVAVVPKAQTAPRDVAEPFVERVIIEQDDTPVEPARAVTTIAIAINGRAESVVVSRAAEPATN